MGASANFHAGFFADFVGVAFMGVFFGDGVVFCAGFGVIFFGRFGVVCFSDAGVVFFVRLGLVFVGLGVDFVGLRGVFG